MSAEHHARLDEIQAQLDEARDQIPENGASPSVDPEVQQAGVALARAVANSLGHDLPLAVAEGSSTPVIELPEEFVKYGGIGVAVIVAPPPEG